MRAEPEPRVTLEIVKPAPTARRLTVFDRLADRVSYGMGTPLNIGVWIVLVVAWTLLFALHVVDANASFLPRWFTGTAFNFPLNLVTTVAELYIGFLVGAASNRSERNLERTLFRIEAQEAQIVAVEQTLSRAAEQNAVLMAQIKMDTARLDEIHRHLETISAKLDIDLGPPNIPAPPPPG